ncbi:MAG: lysophospholipid acyltransferase family protein [Pyrinomonadaceae bacterium]|nr:lysophospholipid acyltransferase family protein [Pyrinomonadaceae bacterium]
MSEHFEKAYEFQALDRFTAKQRLIIRVAGFVFYLLVKAIGSTLRFERTDWENYESIADAGNFPIYAFWHDRIIAGTYFFRDRGIIVLSSSSFDSEYTARCIQRLGFGIIKGSSTRGGIQALVGMIRMMKAGYAMAFTIDGPKGPRYEAKAGPVLLAKKTGNPLMPFVIECRKFWTVKSWDRLQVPKPFSKANIIIGEPIYVPADAKDEELEAKRLELQRSLDSLVRRGEEWRNSQR